jgi:hypothetical protein
MMVRMTDKPPKDNVIALKKRGRPPFQWTPEIENYILEKIVAGHSIRAIISFAQIGDYNGKPFPAFETIMAYVASNDEFQHKYTRAKDIQQDLMGETIIDIMDGRHPDFVNAELGQRKESAEIRKWVMGKLRRKKWGDVKVTELTGKDGTPLIQPQVIDTRSLPPEAQAALYQALQLIKAQQEAEDISHTTEEST